MFNIRSNLKHWFLLLLQVVMVVYKVSARDFKDFRVQHFGEESLPQVSVWGLSGDRYGFLWIGTQMGLVRFDGQYFKVYTPENTPCLKKIRALEIYFDRDDNVYYMDDGGAFFRLLPTGPVPYQPARTDRKLQFIFEPGHTLPFYDQEHPSAEKTFFYEGRRHDSVITYTFVLGKDTAIHTIPGTKPRHDPAFFSGNTLYLLDKQYRPISMYPGKPLKYMILAGDLQNDPLFMNPDAYVNNAWFYKQAHVTYYRLGNNMYRLDPVGDTMYATKVIANMPMTDIVAFYADTTHHYYAVGTSSDGLYMLYPKEFNTRLLYGNNNINVFYATAPVKDNLFFNGYGYLFDLYKNYEKVIDKTDNAFGLFRRDKMIYFTHRDTLFRLDSTLHRDKRYAVPTPGWLIQGMIDKQGRTWFATVVGLGVEAHNSVRWVIKEARDVNGTPAKNIESIFAKDSNTIWIAYRDGIRKYNIRSGTQREIPEMKGKYVRGLIGDDRGGVWILTYGNGFYYYNNRQFIAMPRDRNNYLSAVHTMLPDKRGYYWMATNKGLFRAFGQSLYDYIDHKATTVKYEYFDKRYGFATNEFNGGCNPCGYSVSDSLIVLPSMIGMVYFNPLNVHSAPLTNDIYVDNIQIDGKQRDYAVSFSVPAEFRSFRCEVTSPYYGVRDNMILEYKIDGVMDDWQPLLDNRYLQFNRLPHGEYNIRIRKLADFATGATKELSIKFVVSVPWYMEAWFIFICTGVLVSLIWLFVWLRLRIVNIQKAKLEMQVRQRTTELASSLDQLKSTVETLEQSQAELYRSNRFREQLTSIVLHDIQTPLRFLQRVMKHVLHTHREMPPETLHKELDDLYSSTAEVASYSEDFLTWIKSQRDAFEVVYKEVQLCGLLDEIGNLYHKIASQKGAVITISCPEDITLRTDPALLSIIIRNLTDNAVKYAPGGKIRISGARTGNAIVISVSDNGTGMTGEQIGKIMSEESSRTVTAAGKLGYQFIKDLLRVLNGSLKINSKPGAGTEVSLYFTIR